MHNALRMEEAQAPCNCQQQQGGCLGAVLLNSTASVPHWHWHLASGCQGPGQ